MIWTSSKRMRRSSHIRTRTGAFKPSATNGATDAKIAAGEVRPGSNCSLLTRRRPDYRDGEGDRPNDTKTSEKIRTSTNSFARDAIRKKTEGKLDENGS
jgi:hypothetical protein